MRLYSDNLVAIIGVTGISDATNIAGGFLKGNNAKVSSNGEIRSVILKDVDGEYRVFFSNLSSEAVNTHFKRQGFIFI